MTNKEKIMIYVDEELKKQIQETAEKEERSMSNLIVFAIKKYLEEVEE